MKRSLFDDWLENPYTKVLMESMHGDYVPRVDAEALRKDAERYRWMRSRKGLTLRSEPQPNVWKRTDGTEFCATHYLSEGGTQHAPADSLDATIDAAIAKQKP
jgi:hypothetical protein